MMPRTQILIKTPKPTIWQKFKSALVKFWQSITYLIRRNKKAREYMHNCGYSFRAAWRHAGKVL